MGVAKAEEQKVGLGLRENTQDARGEGNTKLNGRGKTTLFKLVWSQNCIGSVPSFVLHGH